MSLTGDPTQMRLDWNSAQNAFPSVAWGNSSDNLDNLIMRVETTTYTVEDMCGPPASTVGWHDPGFMHSALIEGLTPGRQYFYQIGDESAHSQSEVLSFWAPPVQEPHTDVDFIIFGAAHTARQLQTQADAHMLGRSWAMTLQHLSWEFD